MCCTLDQHQLDGHLLQHVGQPGDLGLGQAPARSPAPRACTPGLEALNAPSFATVRIRMIVGRPT
jgi:hypothetical protein